jgi:hypothetical protein
VAHRGVELGSERCGVSVLATGQPTEELAIASGSTYCKPMHVLKVVFVPIVQRASY